MVVSWTTLHWENNLFCGMHYRPTRLGLRLICAAPLMVMLNELYLPRALLVFWAFNTTCHHSPIHTPMTGATMQEGKCLPKDPWSSGWRTSCRWSTVSPIAGHATNQLRTHETVQWDIIQQQLSWIYTSITVLKKLYLCAIYDLLINIYRCMDW